MLSKKLLSVFAIVCGLLLAIPPAVSGTSEWKICISDFKNLAILWIEAMSSAFSKVFM